MKQQGNIIAKGGNLKKIDFNPIHVNQLQIHYNIIVVSCLPGNMYICKIFREVQLYTNTEIVFKYLNTTFALLGLVEVPHLHLPQKIDNPVYFY